MSSHWSSPRSLIKDTLMPSDFFESVVKNYCKNTGKSDAFYKNRVIFLNCMWDEVDNMRQCAGCGYILLSNDKKTKLLSCGGCKRMHYCDKRCQKAHWKGEHRAECGSTEYPTKISDTFRLCMGIVTMLTMTSTPQAIISETLDDQLPSGHRVWSYDIGEINDGDNFICNHLLNYEEEGRILIPIWDSINDSLAFVPVSPDYFEFGLENAEMAHSLKDYISDDSNQYLFTLYMTGHTGGGFYRMIFNTWAHSPAHNRHGRIATGGV